MRLALFSWLLLLWVAPAHAGTVAIVSPIDPSPDSIEARSRVHGELLSVGLDVKLIHRPTGSGQTDTRAWLERIAAEGQIDAVIDITGDSPPAADVWVIERAPRRLALSRIVLEPDTRNTAEMLAIRTVEVLRSTFLEHDMASRRRRDEAAVKSPMARPTMAPTSVSVSSPRSGPQERSRGVARLGVELGAAALESLDGVAPAILPLACVDWSVHPGFMFQAALAGLGSRPTVSSAQGSASVAQQYGTLGGLFVLHSHRWFRPFLALSTGVLHTQIEGRADAPGQGHQIDQWSFLADGSIGTLLRLTDSYHLTLATHLQMAAPYVAIHIMDAVVASSGHPNLVLTLTVGAWL